MHCEIVLHGVDGEHVVAAYLGKKLGGTYPSAIEFAVFTRWDSPRVCQGYWLGRGGWLASVQTTSADAGCRRSAPRSRHEMGYAAGHESVGQSDEQPHRRCNQPRAFIFRACIVLILPGQVLGESMLSLRPRWKEIASRTS